MKKLSLYFHPFTWGIKPHKAVDGKFYIQDMDIKPEWISNQLLTKKRDLVSLIKAKPLNWIDYYKVHSKIYIDNIRENKIKYSWITWSKSFLRSQRYISGAIYDAANKALTDKISGALVVEGHHAQKDKGSGFCTFNNLAVAINKLLDTKTVSKIAVIDFDLHFGDGTAAIFKTDSKVVIFDIYGKKHSDDVVIDTSNGRVVEIKVDSKREYFLAIKKLQSFIEKNKPEIAFYVAGMDAFELDRYGGIKGLNEINIKKRDKTIFNLLIKLKIPTVFTLGGGYINYKGQRGNLASQKEINLRRKNLTRLHINTIMAAKEAYI